MNKGEVVLIALDPAALRERFTLWFDEDTTFIFGRSSNKMELEFPGDTYVRYVLTHQSISRIHCSIFTEKGSHILADGFGSNRSKFGTKIEREGEEIMLPTDEGNNLIELNKGDVLSFAGVLRYEYRAVATPLNEETEGTAHA